MLGQRFTGAFEVHLLDNASTDGSLRMVRERFPEINVIEAGRNLGFAGGNNLGIRQAGSTDIVLLNNDTRVEPGWLQALVDTAAARPEAGAVTSKLLFREPPGVIQNAGALLLSDGGGGDRGTGEPDRGQYDQREEVFGFCGAAALLRRRMLEDVGLFDESYFMYYEDLDLSWRMRLRGWSVLYEPAARVIHDHAASSVEWSPSFTFHADRNRLFTILKNAPAGQLLRSFRALLRRAATPGTARPGRRGRPDVRLKVLGSFLIHLPEMLAKRARIRARRRVADAELTRWLYPRELWDARSE